MISAHESWIVETSTSGYAGSPLYDVTTAHISVVASVVVLVLGVLFARNLAFFERARTRLRGLCIEHRTAVVVMVVSAAAHV
ncbi:MAG: hypothetical protein OEX04_03835, partial [Acidimicrobiia bacterium]|nr:hypothetical protein [Acidimicrobiia bacterium]